MAVPVLMHHHVSPAPGLVTVSPEHFRAQVAWLAQAGYRSLGTAEYAQYLAGLPVPEKSVLITFDDGWLDNWLHAHPVLAEFGFRAVLFLVTGLIGNGHPRRDATCLDHRSSKAAVADGRADDAVLRWSEVEAMARAGSFEFHSHTHRHVRWDKLALAPEARDAELANDLEQSRRCLVEKLGSASGHLCWPQGYYDQGYVRVAEKAGFTHLYTVEERLTLPGDDTRRIGRHVVKDRAAPWLALRMGIWRRPRLAQFYAGLRGKS